MERELSAFSLSPGACLRKAASAKAGERARVRGPCGYYYEALYKILLTFLFKNPMV